MAVREIAYKPELTKEQAHEIFRKHFEPQYKVDEFKGPFRDFVIIKSAFVGVAVKLEQDEKDKQTKLVYSGLAPKWWARVLLTGLIGALIGVRLWNPLTNEVEAFIESSPDFK